MSRLWKLLKANKMYVAASGSILYAFADFLGDDPESAKQKIGAALMLIAASYLLKDDGNGTTDGRNGSNEPKR